MILLDEKREFEVRFDDLMKTITFPAWQGEALADGTMPLEQGAGAVRRCPGAGRRPDRAGARARLDQRIALLRHVEALRLYAAGHKGALPASLSDDPRAVARRPVHRQAVPL